MTTDTAEPALPQTRPLESAQLVWQHALIADGVLDVLGVADHDAATLAHALGLGRTQLRRDPDNEAAMQAVSLLARAVAFLGVKPRSDAAAVGEPWSA